MKIKLFETVDDKFAKLGFVKTHESDFVVCYERTDSKFGYVQCLELCHKRNGQHMISSFQKGTNRDGFNNAVGLPMHEAKLCLKKMKQKGWRVGEVFEKNCIWTRNTLVYSFRPDILRQVSPD